VRRPFSPSDRSERDRFLKHLKQRPPVERPIDYGRQSPRLLGEIVDGMTSDYAGGEEERRRMTSELWAGTPTERKKG
jgi:hypothetical protein